MHSMKRGNLCMGLLLWLMSFSQEKLPYIKEISAAGGREKRVTLICFESGRDAIMCNVPFVNFQGN